MVGCGFLERPSNRISCAFNGVGEALSRSQENPMFIGSRFRRFIGTASSDPVLLELIAPGFPPPAHEAEPDLFCRQAAMAGHEQERLEAAHIAVIGCGGLGSWIALGLARMGIRELTLV